MTRIGFRQTCVLLVVGAFLLVVSGSASADVTSACVSSKLGITAKYASCRLTAESKAIKSGIDADYSKCTLDKFTATEARAGARGCPAEGDQPTVQDLVNQCSDSTLRLIAQGRFVDNGDGTVTDNKTGLMWEKKTGTPGGDYVYCPGGATCGNVHDVANQYTWSTGSPWNADGPAFSIFLAELNGASPFAGHDDWRLPTWTELQSIFDSGTPGCGTVSPCIDPVFGPTEQAAWSSTTNQGIPSNAWYVSFIYGPNFNTDKTFYGWVRAVRSGS